MTDEQRKKHREYMKEYRKRDSYKVGQAKIQSRWRVKNLKKAAAHIRVHSYIKKGLLVRPTNCDSCGVGTKPEAHHPDYDKPSDVKWLCDACHKLEHGRLKDMSLIRNSSHDE